MFCLMGRINGLHYLGETLEHFSLGLYTFLTIMMFGTFRTFCILYPFDTHYCEGYIRHLDSPNLYLKCSFFRKWPLN
jgi:hypothetical protein